MSNFDGVIDPVGEWAEIPSLSASALAIGGPGGVMNAQAVAIAKRLNLLKQRDYVRPQDTDLLAGNDDGRDDTAAVIAAIQDGRPVYWGDSSKVYRCTNALLLTLTRSATWHSDGAKLKLDRVESIKDFIAITQDGHDFYLFGKLIIDAQSKSYSGVSISNNNSPKCSYLLDGFDIKNCYRNGTTFSGGDGLRISGNHRSGKVSNLQISGIRMAVGAGIFGSQGVSGLTITRDNANSLDAELLEIESFYIENIYSEDPAYIYDQDGIKVFTAYNSAEILPRKVACYIQKGKIKNSHGRAIKVQTEWCSVSDIKIERDETIYGGGFVGNPDIDFQVGGGIVENIQCQYSGNFPSRIINFSLTQNDERLNPTSVTVRSIVAIQSGSGGGINRVSAISSEFDAYMNIDFHDIAIYGSKVPQYFHTVSSDSANSRIYVNITKSFGRATDAVLYRSGIVVPAYVNGMGISMIGTSVPFVGAANSGSLTASLVGTNVGVT